MNKFKDFDKVKVTIQAVQWLGKLSDLPDEILELPLSVDNDKILTLNFGNNYEKFKVNDYIGKEDSNNYFKIAFKDFPVKYKEKNK